LLLLLLLLLLLGKHDPLHVLVGHVLVWGPMRVSHRVIRVYSAVVVVLLELLLEQVLQTLFVIVGRTGKVWCGQSVLPQIPPAVSTAPTITEYSRRGQWWRRLHSVSHFRSPRVTVV
jgi:hypothetical protein